MDKDTIQQIVDQSTVITNAHISFQNAVKKIRKEDGQITDICSAHQELKQAVDSFELPRTSRSSQKTQQSTNPEQSSKRKSTEPGPSTSTDHLVPPKKRQKQTADSQRSSSSTKQKSRNISLQDLKKSINDKPNFNIQSRAELHNLKSSEEKLLALFNCEQENNRRSIRLVFFQGFYIHQICTNENISTKELARRNQLSYSDFQRKRQLYTKLGRFRRILFSTLPIYQFYNSTTSLYNELRNLPEKEQKYWLYPPLDDDPIKLVDCIAQCYNCEALPAKFFYACDLISQNLQDISGGEILSEYFTELRNLTSFRDVDIFKEQLNSISQNRCIIGYEISILKDYYYILEVSDDANLSEIKTAYRKLALQLHPDKQPGKEEQFMQVKEAYTTLADEEKKRRYDTRRVKQSDYEKILRFTLLTKNNNGVFETSDFMFLRLMKNLQSTMDVRVYSFNLK